MRITLENCPPCAYVLRAEDGRSVLIQSDWDYPGVATSFGWVACPCGKTDGTIDCAHREASAMIEDARRYLDSQLGMSVDDPGYF